MRKFSKKMDGLTRAAALCLIFGGGIDAALGGNEPYFDGKQSLYNQAPAGEVAALPKYCWGRYIPKFKGAKYHISRASCGEWHNHFCQGLLQFNRSQHPMATRNEKSTYLHQAIGNFEYTWKGIRDYRSCPIRKHVQVVYRRAVALRAGGR